MGFVDSLKNVLYKRRRVIKRWIEVFKRKIIKQRVKNNFLLQKKNCFFLFQFPIMRDNKH